MTEKTNKNMNYRETNVLIGTFAIFLFIAVIEMIILQVGSWYWQAIMLLICAFNMKSVRITLNQAKSEGKKSMVQLGLFCLVTAGVIFAVLWYIR